MHKKFLEKIVQDGGLGLEAFKFLKQIDETGENGWGTNCPDEVEKIDFYRDEHVISCIQRFDDQLEPPEFFTLRLTEKGEALVAYLEKIYG